MDRVRRPLGGRLVWFLLSFVWLAGPTVVRGDAASPSPQGPVNGERLVYNIHWKGIPAGAATTAIMESPNGEFQLDATLVSAGAVEFFYTVRDRVISRGRRNELGLQAVYYLKSQREGRHTRRTEYRFDRENDQVTRQLNDDPIQVMDDVADNVNDPLTALTRLRGLGELQPESSLFVPVLDGDRQYLAQITTGPVERLSTPLGWFEVFPVYPQLEHSRLFRHRGGISVWMTADERRIPVRIETKVTIGAVAADLIGFVDGRGGEQFLHDRTAFEQAFEPFD